MDESVLEFEPNMIKREFMHIGLKFELNAWKADGQCGVKSLVPFIGGRRRGRTVRDGKAKVFGDSLFWEVSPGLWTYIVSRLLTVL